MEHTMNNTKPAATFANLSADILRAAQTFAGVRDVRYYLNGVYVEPNPNGVGVIVVATDGHRIVVLLDATGEADGAAIIKPVKVPRYTKREREDGTRAEFRFLDGRVTFTGGASLPAETIDGRYPDFRALLASYRLDQAPTVSGFNPEYLGAFAAVSEAYGLKHPVCVVHPRGDSAALVTFPGLPAVGVVMPLRVEQRQREAVMPEFLRIVGDADQAAPVQDDAGDVDQVAPVQDDAGDADQVAPVQDDAGDVDQAAPVPLARILVTRAEGPINGSDWNAGETREFAGADAWEAAHKALATLCLQAPRTGGYDKCDVSIEWANGDGYGYRFDAQHPDCAGRDTPDIARHVLQHLHFLQGHRCPLHMTADSYADLVAQDYMRKAAAEALQLLTVCAFPLSLDPPAAKPVDQTPSIGRRCWYRGWGPGGVGAGSATVVDLTSDGEWAPENVRFSIVMDHDHERRTFGLESLIGPRPLVRMGDDYATDVQTMRAIEEAAAKVAAANVDKATADVRHADEVARLRAAHPELIARGDDPNGVGKNLRKLFKAAGIKASITKDSGSMCSSYRIRLAPGATDDQVATANEIAQRFEAGYFNGMDDSYHYVRSAWGDAFGSVRYVFVSRDYADLDQPQQDPDGNGPAPGTVGDAPSALQAAGTADATPAAPGTAGDTPSAPQAAGEAEVTPPVPGATGDAPGAHQGTSAADVALPVPGATGDAPSARQRAALRWFARDRAA
jgi:hypothetical protein